MYRNEEYRTLLIRVLGNSPKLRMIDFFLDNPVLDFTKKEVIEALGMSKQTLYKYFDDLEELGVVKISRKIGKANLYKINLDNPMVKMLSKYTTELSLQEMEKQAKALPAR